jgi:alanine racemase
MRQTRHLKWVEIDRKAIRDNLRTVRTLIGKNVELLAVVKADAYGHGAEEVSRIALKAGAAGLGVLTIDEARTLRKARIRGRIVLMAPPLLEDAAEVIAAKLEPAVDSLKLARALSRLSKNVLPVHVDIDFGLGRWGVRPKNAPELLQFIQKNKRLRLAGISAHLDYVPGKNAVEAEDKLRVFNRIAARIKKENPKVVRHCANSSILLDFPHWQMDMVRAGNLLYGINPTSRDVALKNPWRLQARIISIQEVSKGQSIGYASEYLAPRKMRLASIPVGYADGLTMEPAERFIGFGREFRYWGMLKGKKAPFVGRCGISHVIVDVSKILDAKPGDIVTLPIRRTAASARLPRIYV